MRSPGMMTRLGLAGLGLAAGAMATEDTCESESPDWDSTYLSKEAVMQSLMDSAHAAGYREDVRMIETEGGLMINIYRGAARSWVSGAWNCESGLLINGANGWSLGLRIFYYLFTMLYCFLGIAIVADVFMGAIEKITSKTYEKTITNEDGKEEVVTEKWWNATIANLTLMALGSSAPEIILSIFGVVFALGEEADPLGPGTIVGSAAFNLLCITSVCIVAPVPDTRTIRQMSVYKVTAFFSVWAYVWLLLIIDFISPEVIEVWEALVTLAHFPLLVILAYWADKDWKLSGKALSDKLSRSGLVYRQNAVRLISGAPRINVKRTRRQGMAQISDEEQAEMDEKGMTSDPYVIVSYGGVTEKTVVKKKSLNPTWKEAFGFPLDAKNLEVKLTVMDHDDLSKDDFMGAGTLLASQSADKVTHTVTLTDKKGNAGAFGTLEVETYYNEQTQEMIVRVQNGKNLLALEKANARSDAVASALGAQMRKVYAKINAFKAFKKDLMAGYKVQFENALSVSGDIDEDGNQLPPETMDLVMHFLTVFWKVFFALIPPPDFYGGWLAFIIALMFIGLVTFVVGELAGLLGCVIGLKKATTAITFVALGTSLPDMFASKLAAVEEETADSAVGNVTGSNGVNVFLGIGLPWTIAALYGQGIGEPFVARSNGFGLSVVVFCGAAIIFILMLYVRRVTLGGELGGPKRICNMHAGFGVFLWLAYIAVSALRQYEMIGDWWTVKSVAGAVVAPAKWVEEFGYTCGVWS